MQKTLFFIIQILFLVSLVKLIQSSFNLHGKLLILQLVVMLGLMLAGLLSNFSEKNYWPTVFAFCLIDVLFVYMLYGTSIKFVALPLFSGMIGFFAAIIYSPIEKSQRCKEEFEDITQDSKEDSKENGPETQVLLEEYSEDKKFVGSKSGKSYHKPGCEWAEKIKTGSKVWFNSEKDAKNKGYKPHSCLK